MSTDTTATSDRPLVGIDDETRPMTDEEFTAWLARPASESAVIPALEDFS